MHGRIVTRRVALRIGYCHCSVSSVYCSTRNFVDVCRKGDYTTLLNTKVNYFSCM